MALNAWKFRAKPTDQGDGPATLLAIICKLLGNVRGATRVTGTSANARAGGYCRIEHIGSANAVIATVTADDLNGGTAQTAITLQPGDKIVANISTFTLTSGEVIAYHQK